MAYRPTSSPAELKLRTELKGFPVQSTSSLRQHDPGGGARCASSVTTGRIMNRRSARGGITQATAAIFLGSFYLTGSADLLAGDVQVGRYASVRAAPTEAQGNLLFTLVTVEFPARVKTVGEAVQHVLRGSGYRLATEAAADPMRSDLLGFPLPEAHRSLGPMPHQDAVEALGVPAFRLVEDPLHRLVSFERCALLKRSPSNTRDPDRR